VRRGSDLEGTDPFGLFQLDRSPLRGSAFDAGLHAHRRRTSLRRRGTARRRLGAQRAGRRSRELTAGRRRTAVTLTEVTDPEVRRSVMRAFPVEVPGGVSFFVRLGLVSGADPEQFAAAADQVAVFMIEDRPRVSASTRLGRFH
jgi:hypothetical protein